MSDDDEVGAEVMEGDDVDVVASFPTAWDDEIDSAFAVV